VIHLAAVLLYFAALFLWLRTLLSGAQNSVGRLPGAVAAAGVALHFAALVLYTARWEELPLVGLAPSLSTLSFLIGIALVATLGLGEAVRVGILLLPLMILLEGMAAFLGVRPTPGNLDFQGAWFALHVTLGLAGVGGMALAGASGALYLVQFRELKSKRLGRLFQFLPPLATLDRLGRVGVVVGFTTLTLAILLGWAWTLRFRQTFAGANPETIWAVFMWVVMLSVLLVRLGGGRVERRSALAGVVGFGLIVVSFVLIRLSASGAGGAFL
jgi:ABC-type uncharacterized transport system permease subunit